MRKSYLVGLVIILMVASATLAGCSSGADASMKASSIVMAEAGSMPSAVQAAPSVVTEAYRFATVNQDVLQLIPCYCGCGAMGHESNYDCFWQKDGEVEEHALGCGICVDIAQDVMRGMEQGRTMRDIRQQIDSDYSRFGPATDTPPVSSDAL